MKKLEGVFFGVFVAWSAGLGRVKAEPPPKRVFVLEGAVELAAVVLLLPKSVFEVEGVALVVPLPLPPKVGIEVEAGAAPPPNMLDEGVDAAELPKSPPAVPVFGALEPNNPPVLAGLGAPKILLVAPCAPNIPAPPGPEAVVLLPELPCVDELAGLLKKPEI